MGVFFQVLNASLADATAASTSAGVAKGTRASTCCVAGLTTSRHSVVVDSTNLPPMSSLTVVTCVWGVVVASMNLSPKIGSEVCEKFAEGTLERRRSQAS